MNTIISQHISNALEIIQQIPDQYKEIGFEVVLAHLLSSEVPQSNDRQILSIKGHSDVDRILRSNFEWPSTKISKMKPTPQILLILKIAKENFGINELSSTEVQKILKEKFRILKSSSAISMLLMEKLGKFVDRIQEGNKFYYRITENGLSVIDSEMVKLGS